MSSDKYCAALVNNIEETLAKKRLHLPSKCVTPITQRYCPEMDAMDKLKSVGVQWYQEIIGSLGWAIEIRSVDILHKVLLLSNHLALPREGHLEEVIHVLRYLKLHKKMKLCFDSGYPNRIVV